MMEELEVVEKCFKDRVAVLAVAYHNLAVELEFLKNYESALDAYEKAYLTTKDYLGESDTFTHNLMLVYQKAEK